MEKGSLVQFPPWTHGKFDKYSQQALDSMKEDGAPEDVLNKCHQFYEAWCKFVNVHDN